MGKKRISTIGAREKTAKTRKTLKREQEKVRIPGLKGGERVVAIQVEPLPEQEKEKKVEKKAEEKAPRPPKVRGKKYKAVRAKVDRTKTYPLPEAVKLVKNTSMTRFDGSVEVHLNVADTKVRGEVELPYFKAKAKKVKIADEKLLADLGKGKVDFDILLATPAFMPKLAKYARVLGPRGLMPNPKTGTIVEDPEKAISKFEKPTLLLKTEKDQPLIHSVIGKVSQSEKELEENFKALVEAIDVKKIRKAVLTSTMGPGIKVDVTSI